MSRRIRKRDKKEEEPQVTEDNGEVQPNVEPSKTFTQTMELVNKIREITETVKPTDLENISKKLDKLEELGIIGKEISDIKNELMGLSTYAKLFFGIGIAALLIFCVNGVVTLLNNLQPK